MSDAFFPESTKPLSVVTLDVSRAGTLITEYYSDSGKITNSSDTPADTGFSPRLIQPGVWERSLLNNFAIGGLAASSIGDITLNNTDGRFNTYIKNNSIDGREIAVYWGRKDDQFSDYQILFKAFGSNWFLTEDELVIVPEGVAGKLDVSIQSNVYGGTGGADGDSNLQGKHIPLSFGELYNIPPPLLNSDLIYQVHGTAIEEITAVYDQGVALTRANSGPGSDGDFATYAALAAATTGVGNDIESGEFATCITDSSGAYIRVADAPVGQITVDLKGCKLDGVYVDKPADIIKRFITVNGGLGNDRVNASSFASFNLLFPHAIGLWIDTEDRKIPEVIDEITTGLFAVWGENDEGRFTLGRVDSPQGGFTIDVEEEEVIDFEEVPLPEQISPAIKTIQVGYKKNHFVQIFDIDEVNITDERRLFLQDEYRFVKDTNSTVANLHVNAKTLDIVSLLATQAGATAVASYAISTYTSGRRLIKILLGHKGFSVDLLSKVRLSYTKSGINLQRFVVVEKAVDASSNTCSLTLFG